MNHRISFYLIAAGMAAGTANFGQPASQFANTAEVLSLDQVVGEVLTNNPTLKAANATWEAMKQRIPQARAWADPRIGFDQRLARFVGVPPNSFTDEKLMV